MKVAVIIPAYNEGPRIYDVLTSLQAHPSIKRLNPMLIVIDDGSVDDTAEKIKKTNVIFLQHPVNRGQGASLMTGNEYAITHDADFIMHFDGDGQHNIEDIERFIQHLSQNNLDIVLGSRFKALLSEKDPNQKHKILIFFNTIFRGLFRIDSIPFTRRLLLIGSYVINTLITGVLLTDGHNGLRAFTKDTAKKLILTQDRYAHPTEYITEIKRLKLKYEELQVRVSYETGKKSQGFFQGLVILKELIIGKIK